MSIAATHTLRRTSFGLFVITLLLALPVTRDAALAIGFLLPICLLATCAAALVNSRLAAVTAVLSLGVLLIGLFSNLHL